MDESIVRVQRVRKRGRDVFAYDIEFLSNTYSETSRAQG